MNTPVGDGGIFVTLLNFTLHVVTALICGLVIGAERQWRQRTAGLRTNALVALGSALFVTISGLVPEDTRATRVAAQVVSGIGFIGAGVIMHEGFHVQGLNTAATLWCSAAAGTLAGSGFYWEALIGTSLVTGANLFLRPMEHKINSQPLHQTELETRYLIRVVCPSVDEAHVRSTLLRLISSESLLLLALHSEDLSDETGRTEVVANVLMHGRTDHVVETVVSRMKYEEGIRQVSWKIE